MKKSVWVLLFVIVLIGYWSSVFLFSDRAEEISILTEENKTLRNKLALYESSPGVLKEGGFNGLSAKVFSSYPFNNRSLIVISAGRIHGLSKGMPVTVEGNVLIGQVEKVGKYYSVVKTIFDPSWSSPIRAGENRIDGLLVGGVEPEIQLVEKESDIQIGDTVRSVGDEFPHGLILGTVATMSDDPARAFREAVLTPDAALNSLKTVFVITDFLSD